MSTAERLPPRHLATDDDVARARTIAHDIVEKALARDPGPLVAAQSISHYVYIGGDVVVKIIDAVGHTRLNRETAIAREVPAGITAALIADGVHRYGTAEVRFACFTRMPGTTPGMRMPGVDRDIARRWTEDAVIRLERLHTWRPTGTAARTLSETLDHGGFTGRSALLAEIESIAELNHHTAVSPRLPPRLLDGLKTIAEQAPTHAGTDLPVHADCHWGNWLTEPHRTTALLDFEWARYGEPADDWFFLASGPHFMTVLAAIAEVTTTALEDLRAACEIREAAFIAGDLREALPPHVTPTWLAGRRVDLENLVVGRRWWRSPFRAFT